MAKRKKKSQVFDTKAEFDKRNLSAFHKIIVNVINEWYFYKNKT